jgi:hypothetical protein
LEAGRSGIDCEPHFAGGRRVAAGQTDARGRRPRSLAGCRSCGGTTRRTSAGAACFGGLCLPVHPDGGRRSGRPRVATASLAQPSRPQIDATASPDIPTTPSAWGYGRSTERSAASAPWRGRHRTTRRRGALGGQPPPIRPREPVGRSSLRAVLGLVKRPEPDAAGVRPELVAVTACSNRAPRRGVRPLLDMRAKGRTRRPRTRPPGCRRRRTRRQCPRHRRRRRLRGTTPTLGTAPNFAGAAAAQPGAAANPVGRFSCRNGVRRRLASRPRPRHVPPACAGRAHGRELPPS